jgi:hypothetical protein
MEPGALIRKHPVDAAVLCLFLCVVFFGANSSLSDQIGYPDSW